MPAIGASTTGVSQAYGPIRSGRTAGRGSHAAPLSSASELDGDAGRRSPPADPGLARPRSRSARVDDDRLRAPVGGEPPGTVACALAAPRRRRCGSRARSRSAGWRRPGRRWAATGSASCWKCGPAAVPGGAARPRRARARRSAGSAAARAPPAVTVVVPSVRLGADRDPGADRHQLAVVGHRGPGGRLKVLLTSTLRTEIRADGLAGAGAGSVAAAATAQPDRTSTPVSPIDAGRGVRMSLGWSVRRK